MRLLSRFPKRAVILRVAVVLFLTVSAIACTGGKAARLHDRHQKVGDSVDEVDVFIGTGGHWWGVGSSMPGAMVPNGMMKLSPDTHPGRGRIMVWPNPGGYQYDHTMIRGFSHTHLPGTGASDLANFNIMPVLGKPNGRVSPSDYRSSFRHETESASPGYYSVQLDRHDIRVELTATAQVGFHRWTFPDGENDAPYILIDVSYANYGYNTSAGAEVTVDPDAREVYGYTDQRGDFSRPFGGVPIYFVARFSDDFIDHGVWQETKISAGRREASGKRVGAYVGFRGEIERASVKVGISFIGVEQARTNLDSQITDWDFEAVRRAARTAWESRLSDIRIEGGTPAERRKFYTAMYHLDMLPTTLTESGGGFQGFDRVRHKAEDFTYYSDLSLWDTYRIFHPLIALIRPSQARDFVVSLIKMYEQGGAFPRWPMAVGDSDYMIGTPAANVIGDAVVRGIDDFDLRTAYRGLRDHATKSMPYGSRPGVAEWTTLGYVPDDIARESVSQTLEYALNDFCMARIADALGETADRDLFSVRASNHRNVWDERTRFHQPRRSDGSWRRTPEWKFDRAFTEGNARQWRWHVPHDAPGLIELMGGRESFVRELEGFFENSADRLDTRFPDLHYWHGNEPDLHAPYLFNDGGRPDLTQKWVRWIMANRYSDAPDGLDGNDDGGTLSAWFIFSALGIYPAPCSDAYWIGSPLFPRAVVRVAGGELAVVAENAGGHNRYVQSVTWNDEALSAPFISHRDLSGGGTLRFVMGENPSEWGRELKSVYAPQRPSFSRIMSATIEPERMTADCPAPGNAHAPAK